MSDVKRILIVEDDSQLAQLTTEYLTFQGFKVEVVDNGNDAPERIVQQQPDLVILDLMLPGKDGITICREIRNQYSGCILMLTASDEPIDQVVGLEIGADDYVSKPIEPRILLARIRALLRRVETSSDSKVTNASNSDSEVITAGDLKIHSANRDVFFQGEKIEFNTQEYELLLILANNAGVVVSRDQLFLEMKGYEYDGQNRFVDILISQVRGRLPAVAHEIVKTVRGKGYLLTK